MNTRISILALFLLCGGFTCEKVGLNDIDYAAELNSSSWKLEYLVGKDAEHIYPAAGSLNYLSFKDKKIYEYLHDTLLSTIDYRIDIREHNEYQRIAAIVTEPDNAFLRRPVQLSNDTLRIYENWTGIGENKVYSRYHP
jgi:hypothetical protein